MDHLEEKARAVGNDRKALRHRLNVSKSCLVSHFRACFQNPEFDFERKRLVSDDGTMALQWSTRPHPDEPADYHNQQTSIGTVRLVVLTAMLGSQAQRAELA
jgi:hypothetical protein